jgi:hypothetical protein
MPVHSVTQAVVAAAERKRSHVAHEATSKSFSGALAKASTKSSADTPDRVLDSKKVPKGEKTSPVDGHAYADITAGPRNGMYLNTSGNKRDGQAFVLVKRDGKEFHVYGTGKDRLVVCLKRKDDAAGDAKSTAPAGTTGSS